MTNMTQARTSISSNYESYTDFKGWGAFDEALFQARSAYFEGEFRACKIGGARILEIGYGRGYFLHWARRKGAEVCGIEISPEMYERLKGEGFEVYIGNVLDNPDLAERQFDLIVALDVFEHLPLDDLKQLLVWCAAHLAVGGRLIARFPNTQSPFSMIYQHGDVTHVTYLSASIFQQLLLGTGLELERSGNAYRAKTGGLPQRLARLCIRTARNLLEMTLAYLYFGGRRIPLDPNVTVVAIKE